MLSKKTVVKESLNPSGVPAIQKEQLPPVGNKHSIYIDIKNIFIKIKKLYIDLMKA